LTEIISGGGAGFVSGGKVIFDTCKFKDNSATRIGGTFQFHGGESILINCDVSAYDYSIMPPINADAGSFHATDLTLTGSVEGVSAVISYCNSACGQGKIGQCSKAGEYAPQCQVNCECIECPAGTYSDAIGTSTDTCYPCPATYSSFAGSSKCSIAAEGYYIDTKDGSSVACPEHAYCAGGLELPRPLVNHWIDRSSLQRATTLDRCYRKTCSGATIDDDADDSSVNQTSCWLPQCYGEHNSCPAARCDSDSLQCTEGARGPLCGSCESGYSYSSSSQKCLTCQFSSIEEHKAMFGMTLVIILSILLVLFIWLQNSVAQRFFKGKWWVIYLQRFVRALKRHSDSGALRVLVRV
jgi:hypothetical protein